MHVDAVERFEERVQDAAAHAHAAMARLVRDAAEFEALDAWQECGYTSCAHWLSVFAGFDLHSGREVLRVGEALRELPRLAAAFAGGELSFDKLRAITRVASPADEQIWLEVGRASTGAQLARICRAFGRALTEREMERLEAARGVDVEQSRDGLVTITARLLPEEAEIVFAALEKVSSEAPPLEGRDWQARDADALVEVCGRALVSAPDAGEVPPARVIIHVDEDIHAGGPNGRCHGRFRLSGEAARELSCDGEVQHQTERDGVPIDLGRSRRIVSSQLARAMRARDGGCVFPGCGRLKVHAHHLEHWAQGGQTNLANLASLCSFHHHAYHRGLYRISGRPGALRFETRDQRPIGPPPKPARGRPPQPTGSPMPTCYSPRMQFKHTVMVIEDGLFLARAQSP